MTDYSSWPTKQQVADLLGIATKTVEKIADVGEIQKQIWKRPGKPAIAVYHPADVERARKARNPDAAPFVVPPSAAAAAAESVAMTRVLDLPGSSGSPVALAAAFAAAMRPPAAPRPFLALDEAAEYSGLPRAFLRSLVREGRIGFKAGRAWRIRRAELDRL